MQAIAGVTKDLQQLRVSAHIGETMDINELLNLADEQVLFELEVEAESESEVEVEEIPMVSFTTALEAIRTMYVCLFEEQRDTGGKDWIRVLKVQEKIVKALRAKNQQQRDITCLCPALPPLPWVRGGSVGHE